MNPNDVKNLQTSLDDMTILLSKLHALLEEVAANTKVTADNTTKTTIKMQP